MINLVFFTVFLNLQSVIAVIKDLDKLDIEQAIRSCKHNNCEYCCLSNLQCGTLTQCRTRVVPILILEFFFYFIVLTALLILLKMCLNNSKSVNSRT